MRKHLPVLLAAAHLFLHSLPASSQIEAFPPKQGSGVPNYPVVYQLPTPAAIKAVIDRIQTRVIAHSPFVLIDTATGQRITDYTRFNKNAAIPESDATFEEWSYPNGVSLSACDALTRVTGDTSYRHYAIRFYDFIFQTMPYFQALKAQGLIKKHPFEKMVHMQALDHCGSIAAALIRIQQAHPDPRFRHWIDTVAAYITNRQFRLKDHTIARERPQPESLWADDLYMCIPFLTQYGLLTGDSQYYDDAVRQAIQLSARLFDPETGLFDHGWNVNSGEYDPRFYWARANGWCTMAMAELLTILPENHPGRDKVFAIYRKHLQTLARLQDGTGLWHNMLDHSETFLETSASAMFVFSMAKAVNEGWLSPVYGPIAITGWNALATKVTADGEVCGIVEGTTFANDNTYYFNRGTSCTTTFYGTVMLAGAEIFRLVTNPKFEIIAPTPNSVNSAMHFRLKGDKPPR